MIYISDKEQSRIKRKMAMLPSWMRNDKVGILVFETVGTLILAYGICMGRFLHPIEDRVINRAFDFLISCFFYFALSVAAPFSGGHLNPAVTLALSRKRKDVRIGLYICAQILGGLIGAGIAYGFFGVVPFFYWQEVSFGSLWVDLGSEVFGTAIFVFFILMATETNYMAGQYFRYMLIAIMLLIARIFTLRKGCLNPAIAFSFQLFAAVQKGNALLLVYSLFLIVGAFIGGLLAVYFFWNFYAPLRDGLALQKMRTSDDSERFEDSSQEG